MEPNFLYVHATGLLQLGLVGSALVFGASVVALRRSGGSVHALEASAGGSGDEGRRATRGDLWIVAAVAVGVAVVQLVWIWQHRRLSNLDFDEARYVAEAFRFRRRYLLDGPVPFVPFNGPVMPALSGLLTIFGPVDVRAVIAAGLVPQVGVAVATTGVAGRLTTRRAARFCGIAVSILPVSMAVAQSYLLAQAATFAMTAMVWALLAGRRGVDRRIWVVGGLLVLAGWSRGMVAGLVPVAAVAVVVHCRGTRVGRYRALASVSAAGVVLAWSFLTWGRGIVNYVLGGLSTPGTQAPGLLGRLAVRWSEVSDGFGMPMLPLAITCALVGVVLSVRGRSLPAGVDPERLATLAFVVLGCGAVLLAGGDYGPMGFWDYPLIPLLLVLLVVFAERGLPGRWATGVGGFALVWVTYFALIAVWILPADAPLSRMVDRYSQSKIESTIFEPRFVPERRDEQARANDEWDDTAVRVDRRLREVQERVGGRVEFFWRGAASYYGEHTSTILSVIGHRPEIPFVGDLGQETDGDPATLLEPTGPDWTRLLLVNEHGVGCPDSPSCSFTADQLAAIRSSDEVRLVATVRSAAERKGWRPIATIALPLGDRLVVLADPTTARRVGRMR